MSEMLIADARVPKMTIDVPASSPQAEYAATELRYYLGMMTGALLEIRIGQPEAKGKSIRLELVNDPKLKDDGFTLKTSASGLTITGGKRGVIYGAYEFLERLGCRFFTPHDEKVPVCEHLVMPKLKETQVPILEYRLHNTYDLMHYQRFSVKSRVNGTDIRERFGGCMKYALFVHTIDTLVPYKQAKDHPEYFAMLDGKRYVPDNPAYSQRCLTNPDVFKIACENVRKTLLAHPECRIISISQMDNGAHCTCPKCAKVDREEGSSAGTMIRFVNKIATKLKKEFPDVVFDTLAYQYTRPVTTKTKPVENVCVRLCSIECCFAHPMKDQCDPSRGVEHPDGTKSDFLNDLQNWGKVCNRMYIWDYVTCFSHYPTPHPNWHTLQPNMQTFVENNVKGVFEQGNSQIGGGPDLVELRQYLIGKLLWDPYCDLEKHITEFLEFYYGAAAPFVREYMEAVCKKCEDDNIHVGFNDAPVKDFVSEKMLTQYEKILAKAEKAVKDEPLYRLRVQKIQFCPRYLRLKRKAMLKGKTDTAELNAFFTDWRKAGFTRMHEWVCAETAHRAFLSGHWRGEELYEHWAGEGPELQ